MEQSGRKVVVITGASSGIGAAVARELAKRGCALVLSARNAGALRALADEIGGDARAVTADVTRRADVERLRDQALAAFGHVDVWINNAGRGITRSVLELSDDDVDEMVAVNVKGPLYGMQAILPHFQERGSGHVINVSSFLGRVPIAPPRSVYSAAKAMLNSLSSNLRMELRDRWPGIHVTTFMPGIVTTPFAANALGGVVPAQSMLRATGRMAPQTAEEVAASMAEVIERPRAEVYTNPAHAEVARAYFADVGAFEQEMGREFGPRAEPAAS